MVDIGVAGRSLVRSATHQIECSPVDMTDMAPEHATVRRYAGEFARTFCVMVASMVPAVALSGYALVVMSDDAGTSLRRDAPQTHQQLIVWGLLGTWTVATLCLTYALATHRLALRHGGALVAALALAWFGITAMSAAWAPPPNCSLESANGGGPEPFMPCE